MGLEGEGGRGQTWEGPVPAHLRPRRVSQGQKEPYWAGDGNRAVGRVQKLREQQGRRPHLARVSAAGPPRGVLGEGAGP